MKRAGLTSKMHECLTFIRSYIAEHDGVSPSFQEICDGLGLHSKSGVHRLICALEDRGLIVRMEARARSVSIPQDAGTITLMLPSELDDHVRRRASSAGISPEKYIQLCIQRASSLVTTSAA